MFDFRYTDQYASFLIRLAWTVEIIAALIGLTISIIVGVSAGLSDQFEESLLGQGALVLVRRDRCDSDFSFSPWG